MSLLKRMRPLACALIIMSCSTLAQAQWAVVDVGAIAQLIQQLQTMQQQLMTARSDLMQAQQAYQSITGTRGMERLLSGTVRNYLPVDWTQIASAMNGSGYGELVSDIRGAMTANAVLSSGQLDALWPAERQPIQALRQTVATQEAIAHEALSAASNRFAAIQLLIDAIPGAGDQKAILDLQARISAEQGMLQNEQTKLQVLFQSTQANARATAQQLRETVIAGHGKFETRFQPIP